jgi:hypothetical protein
MLSSKVKSPRKKVILEKQESKLKAAQVIDISDDSDDEYSEPEDLDEYSINSDKSEFYEPFVQRKHMVMFKETHGKAMKEKKGNPKKFTDGTNPEIKDLLKFIMDENWGCPSYFPMLEEDAKVTEVTLMASGNDPEIPISEHIRKEFFYKASMAFH